MTVNVVNSDETVYGEGTQKAMEIIENLSTKFLMKCMIELITLPDGSTSKV
jgi:hypothetical protein